MTRRPPSSTPTDTLSPYSTLFRSVPPQDISHHVASLCGFPWRECQAQIRLPDANRLRMGNEDGQPRGDCLRGKYGSLFGNELGEIQGHAVFRRRNLQVRDRKSTRLNSSHSCAPRMPSSPCTTKKHKRPQ